MKTRETDFRAEGHGKTAPWVDLVNSLEWDTFGNPTDHLREPAWSKYFLRQWRFPAPPGKTPPLAKLSSLRGTLRRCSEALAAVEPMSPAEVGKLNRVLSVRGTRQIFQRQNGLQLEFVPAANGWDSILAEIVRSFVETLDTGEAARVKICRNGDCRWIFYDATKGKTRVWCSDKSCGNRERVRRSRARHDH
jgi:predicted RNA-binding Zn ribbon-like protein